MHIRWLAQYDRYFMDRDDVAAIHMGRSSADVYFDWRKNIAASKGDLCGSCTKKDFVDVVMENLSKVTDVVACQCDGNMFGDCVANRIRVSKSLALDDLDVPRPR